MFNMDQLVNLNLKPLQTYDSCTNATEQVEYCRSSFRRCVLQPLIELFFDD